MILNFQPTQVPTREKQIPDILPKVFVTSIIDSDIQVGFMVFMVSW